MRFRIVENLLFEGWQIPNSVSDELSKQYKEAKSGDEKRSTILQWLDKRSVSDKRDLNWLVDLIIRSVDAHGFTTQDIKTNDFLKLIKSNLLGKKELTADELKFILEGMLNDDIEFDKDTMWLTSPTLGGRPKDEFEYTVKIMYTLTNPNRLKKYFKDISKVNLYELFNGRSLKPAGIKEKDRESDTIWAIIERWSKDNDASGKDAKEKETSNKKATSDDNISTVGELFDKLDINANNAVNKLQKYVGEHFDQIESKFKYKPKLEVQEYMYGAGTKIHKIFKNISAMDILHKRKLSKVPVNDAEIAYEIVKAVDSVNI